MVLAYVLLGVVWVTAAILVWLLLYAQAEQRERAGEDRAEA
jgi:hypothetical protein